MILMMIILFHSSVGHLNSKGVSTSVSYIEFKTLAECEKKKDYMSELTLKAAQDNSLKAHRFDRPKFKIDVSCIRIP